MRILIVNSVIDFGSTGRICTDAANDLLKKGHEVKIAYGRAKAVFKKNLEIGYRIGSDLTVKMHGFYTRLFDKHGCGSKLATKRFIQWANNFNPDVVWIHNIHGYYLNFKLFFSWLKNKGIRVVWTLHDCWAITGHCTHFAFIGCYKWQSFCDKCPQKQQYPKSFISRAKKNFFEKKEAFTSLSNLTIVTPSIWLRQLIKQSFLSKYPVVVINNGIDLNAFYFENSDFRKKHNIEENKKIILCISSVWSDRKGINDVFALCNRLNENEIVVLVGNINHSLSNYPKNMIIIERTNSVDELRRIYSASDVMFNPTYEDTYPNINMESLSCHTPVVCYKTGGAYEMLDERFVVPQGFVDEALAIMRKIFNKQLECDSHKKDFSNKSTIKEYEKILFADTKICGDDTND